MEGQGEVSREDGLFERRALDGFTTETPLRAFSTFDVSGRWAVGRGFRPAYGHLARYLDAIEEKEGWTLVQVILPPPHRSDHEPTMLFRAA